MKIISNLVEAHVFREAGNSIKFLLLKRADKEIYPGLWQMVTGKIKEGEKAYEAALREIKEETGFVPQKLWVAPNVNIFYSHEEDYVSVLPVFAAKVNLNNEAVICDEHCDFKWVNSDDAKNLLAWPGQRKSVDIITDYFLTKRNLLDLLEIEI